MRVASLVVALLCAAAPVHAAESSAPAGLPLSKGTFWVYRGLVKWTVPNSTQVREKTVTWRMEVLDTLERDGAKAAMLKGYPGDLAWYGDTTTPGDYVIVIVGGCKYYLLTGGQDTWHRVQDDDDLLGGLVEERQLLLDLPLVTGKVFGETDQITRRDGLYAWRVEQCQRARIRRVKGVNATAPWSRCELANRTNPDHQIISFVPGVGITRFQYVHHGTVSKADVSLIEYHKGGR